LSGVATVTAIFDACVLYPAPLRDLLMHLALLDVVRARWSADIHEEWMRSLLAQRRDLTRAQLERTRQLMDAHVREGLVSGYASLIPALTLPDPKDCHVLAAAIHAKADVIVTFNLKDFPADTLALFGMEAQHPDKFVTSLLDVDVASVCEAVKRQRASLKNPPKSAIELLQAFERCGLAQTVMRLSSFENLL
jgi:predicted nucleic acid-binding protein